MKEREHTGEVAHFMRKKELSWHSGRAVIRVEAQGALFWRGESGGWAHTEEDDTAIESVLRRFGSRGEVRHRPFASGRVDEDNRGTRSRDTGAFSHYVECRSRIAWRAFVPLQEKRLDSSSTRNSSRPS